MIPLGNNQEEKPDFTLMGRVMDAYAEIEGCRCAEGYILLNPKFAEPWIVDEEHMKPIVEYLEKPVNKCTSDRDDMCMIFEDKASIEIGNAGYAYGTIIIAKDYGKYIGPLNKEDIHRAKKYIKHMKCKAFIDGKMMDIYKYYELLEIRIASDLNELSIGRDDDDE